MGFTAETGQTLTQTHFNFSWRIIVNSTRSANSINAPINPSSDFEIWFALHPLSFPHDSFQSYGGCWCFRPLTVLLLLKNKPFSWPPGSEKGWSDHGVWTNARITCIYSTCFHQLAKGGFFFFFWSFLSPAQANRRTRNPPQADYLNLPFYVTCSNFLKQTRTSYITSTLNACGYLLRQKVLQEAVTKHQ